MFKKNMFVVFHLVIVGMQLSASAEVEAFSEQTASSCK